MMLRGSTAIAMPTASADMSSVQLEFLLVMVEGVRVAVCDGACRSNVPSRPDPTGRMRTMIVSSPSSTWNGSYPSLAATARRSSSGPAHESAPGARS